MGGIFPPISYKEKALRASAIRLGTERNLEKCVEKNKIDRNSVIKKD